MKSKKSYLFVILLLCFICVLSGCNYASVQKKEETITENTIENSNYVQPKLVTSLNGNIEDYIWKNYSKSYFPFPIGYIIDAITTTDSNVVSLGHNDNLFEMSVSEYNIDAFSEIFIQEPKYYSVSEKISAKDPQYCGMTYYNDLVYVLFQDKSEENMFELLCFSVNGGESKSVNTYNLHSTDIRGIALYDKSLIVFGNQLEIIDIIEKETTIINLENELDYIWSVSNCDKGLIVYSAIQGNMLLDTSNNTLTPLDGAMFNLSVCQGYSGEYIQYDLQALYEYDFDKKQSTKLFDYDASNLTGDMPTFVCRLSEKSYLFVADKSDTIVLTGECLGEKIDNEIVNVAILNDRMDSKTIANSKVISTSVLINDYKYIVTEYDYTEVNRLITEISTSNSPDLVLFREDLDTSSSYFENLYNYMDEDRWITRDSFVQSFLAALEVDGELHEIWPSVGVTTIGIRSSDYDPSYEFTTAYCDKIMNEKNYKSVFGTFMTAEDLLKWISDISTGAYINKENATCNFTSKSFKELLKWCNKMDVGIIEGESTDTAEVEDILLSIERLTNPDRLRYIPDIYGQNLTFVGFPNAEGNGSFFENTSISMAIPINSSNKEGAWAFIRSQLVTENQLSNNNARNGFPINIQALERRIGNVLNEQTANDLKCLINNTTKAISYSDQQIRDIIMECGYDYLDSKKTLEETTKVIQSRVGVLVAEKYG